MADALNPPAVKVSPLIKAARWTFLIAGIAYGAKHFSTLQHKENEHRAYIEKMKPIWMAQKNEKKKLMEREELLYLAKETQSAIPADFDKQYPPAKAS
ncbi:hypothetical protein HDE_14508 [Halotydeus destructor]|nr:hypothetical protein HDE_14508 [Halotydeus destructor]